MADENAVEDPNDNDEIGLRVFDLNFSEKDRGEGEREKYLVIILIY